MSAFALSKFKFPPFTETIAVVSKVVGVNVWVLFATFKVWDDGLKVKLVEFATVDVEPAPWNSIGISLFVVDAETVISAVASA